MTNLSDGKTPRPRTRRPATQATAVPKSAGKRSSNSKDSNKVQKSSSNSSKVTKTTTAKSSAGSSKDTARKRPSSPTLTRGNSRSTVSRSKEQKNIISTPKRSANKRPTFPPVMVSSPLHLNEQGKRGSHLPSLALREKVWASLDASRIEPHYSPSFSLTHNGNRPQESKGKTTSRGKAVKVIPLSGLCEVGRNMTVIEYGKEILVVDCGVSFPDESQPGIDSVIPNFSYLVENYSRVSGLFITHGHEDHIGAVSWLLKNIDIPVYAPPLAAALIRLKLEDKGVKGKEHLIHVVKAGDVISLNSMAVEYIHVNHSIADACALAIRTPLGTIVHTGDFKVDYTPINGGPIDLPRLAEIGSEGVLLLLCESTNIEKPGFSPSERKVGESFAEIFSEAKGRVVVATFSSNVYRIQQIIDAAEQHNRRVALIGRSMQNVFKAADSLGYIRRRPETIIELKDVDHYEPNELVIITTGSQGEPLAALTRMAFNEHRKVELTPEDTVIISATPIPGNEKPIFRVINELYKKGCRVVYSKLADIHVSGHAYREEIKLMHELVRPRYFIPIHGEYRMLYLHAELAHDLGQPWDSIFILNNGDIFQFNGKEAGINGTVPAEPVLIDGKSSTTLDNKVLESRRILAEEGIVVLSLAVNKFKLGLAAAPAFQTRGFVYASDLSVIQSEATQFIHRFIKKTINNNKPLVEMLKSSLFKEQLQNLFWEKTARKPIVLVTVLET